LILFYAKFDYCDLKKDFVIMDFSISKASIVAILGPTNTGKTYLAMERMLAHASGMIGFPLRLLAQENYQRAVEIKGYNLVALITGEEKIIPINARYFICTTESMPIDRRVDFIGIDEVQMCADPDRGHIFTDRLLNARGRQETMLLGSETLRPLIKKLVPGVVFINRPRFSTLSYAGSKKITSLPKRSAIVAFSASDVYAFAELIRRQKGGAAVVMGALSPRTRNAQIAMYQSGEVDYIVATDAIGMGLNMDVDHVAFASTSKFDGHRRRPLEPAELAQIAGRAGRHMNDGTFGTTWDAGLIDSEIIGRIENHDFAPIREIFWRNPRPQFTSIDALLKSLTIPPHLQGMVRVRHAEDEMVLRRLLQDPEVLNKALDIDAIKLLWEVCQVPDFSNVKSDGHAQFLLRIFGYLVESSKARLPEDWIGEQVNRFDRTDGDIENLTQRLASIRTWTYIAYRGDWVDNIVYWQKRARTIEDKLSDALHELLTLRFVDRRTTDLMRRIKDQRELMAAVKKNGDVIVEGHYIGRLEGFIFKADPLAYMTGEMLAAKAVEQSAVKALRSEIESRVNRVVQEPDTAFSLLKKVFDPKGEIFWDNIAVAKMVKGPSLMRPRVTLISSNLVAPIQRDRIVERLERWLKAELKKRLAPLHQLKDAQLSGPARGLVFQLIENLGSLTRKKAEVEIEALSRKERKNLRDFGIRIGRESVFVIDLLKPKAINVRALLWVLFMGDKGASTLKVPIPKPGQVSFIPDKAFSSSFYESIGYRVMGKLAIRIDMIERIAEIAWSLNRKKPFMMTPELFALGGCGANEMALVLNLLGYSQSEKQGILYFKLRLRRPLTNSKNSKSSKSKKLVELEKNLISEKTIMSHNLDSPFAILRTLEIPQ
jgi:ATP-dependent RNA helicase SUPV3L1/SUV3